MLGLYIRPALSTGTKVVSIDDESSMCKVYLTTVRCRTWTYTTQADTSQIGTHETYTWYETVLDLTHTHVYTTDTHSLEYTHWYARIHG